MQEPRTNQNYTLNCIFCSRSWIGWVKKDVILFFIYFILWIFFILLRLSSNNTYCSLCSAHTHTQKTIIERNQPCFSLSHCHESSQRVFVMEMWGDNTFYIKLAEKKRGRAACWADTRNIGIKRSKNRSGCDTLCVLHSLFSSIKFSLVYFLLLPSSLYRSWNKSFSRSPPRKY